MKLEFPLRVSNTSNQREHHMVRAKRIKAERRRVWAELKKAKATPPGPFLVVRLTRIGPRKLDDDGVVSALKGTRDQVASWLGVDDGSSLIKWEYASEVGEYGVRIEVESHQPDYLVPLHKNSLVWKAIEEDVRKAAAKGELEVADQALLATAWDVLP